MQPKSVTHPNTSPTLDVLFQRILARQPDAVALVDPLNKPRITGQPPKRLTFAQADRAISALAAHFIEAGLPANSVIAVQLPNTIEFALTALAAHRAGLVVAALPLLWRQAELTVALNRTGARAVVTASRIDGVSHADIAMNAAAECFSIRHVCGFGDDLPEGMASLERAIVAELRTTRPMIQDGRKAALVSFDVTTDGFRAVPRTHLSVIAAALALSLESDVPQGATIMSAFTPCSFAGVASSLAMWLLTGGTLVLHHPFDSEVLERQIVETSCDTLVAPAQLALRLDETELSTRMPRLHNVIGLWRSPEQTASSASWSARTANLTDVYLFGEAGMFAGPPRPGWRAGHNQTRPAWRAARAAGLADIRGNPADPAWNAGLARADGDGPRLRAPTSARRLPDICATARLRRHRLCGTSRPRHGRSTSRRRRPASWRSVGTVSLPRTCRNGLGASARARCLRRCRIA